MSGTSEVQRRRLDEDSKKLLETEATNLASYYSQLAEDKTVNPKLREAAVLYSVAEELRTALLKLEVRASGQNILYFW